MVPFSRARKKEGTLLNKYISARAAQNWDGRLAHKKRPASASLVAVIPDPRARLEAYAALLSR